MPWNNHFRCHHVSALQDQLPPSSEDAWLMPRQVCAFMHVYVQNVHVHSYIHMTPHLDMRKYRHTYLHVNIFYTCMMRMISVSWHSTRSNHTAKRSVYVSEACSGPLTSVHACLCMTSLFHVQSHVLFCACACAHLPGTFTSATHFYTE